MSGGDPLKLDQVHVCGVIHTFNYIVRKKNEYMKTLQMNQKIRQI